MNYGWIGPKVDMRYKPRSEVLAQVRRAMYSPTKPEPHITTDLAHPEGIPEFILELEKDVFKEGYTAIN